MISTKVKFLFFLKTFLQSYSIKTDKVVSLTLSLNEDHSEMYQIELTETKKNLKLKT